MQQHGVANDLEVTTSSSRESVPSKPLTADEIKVLWDGTDEAKRVRIGSRLLWVTLVVGYAIASVAYIPRLSKFWYGDLAFQALGVLTFFVVAALTIAVFESIFKDPKLRAFQFAIEHQEWRETLAIEADASLEIRDLWLVNQRRLDLYHQIATSQARSSFRNGQIAAIIGFLILTVSAVAAYLAPTTQAAIASGVVGAFGGAMGAYIGATFVKSQESASAQMRQYFDHPLVLSKFLVVERLVQDLPDDQKVTAVKSLIEGVYQSGPKA